MIRRNIIFENKVIKIKYDDESIVFGSIDDVSFCTPIFLLHIRYSEYWYPGTMKPRHEKYLPVHSTWYWYLEY